MAGLNDYQKAKEKEAAFRVQRKPMAAGAYNAWLGLNEAKQALMAKFADPNAMADAPMPMPAPHPAELTAEQRLQALQTMGRLNPNSAWLAVPKTQGAYPDAPNGL